jgi:hypothetical protein
MLVIRNNSYWSQAMVASVISLKRTKHKMPKFKFSLSYDEIIRLTFNGFLIPIGLVFSGYMFFLYISLLTLTLHWSLSILRGYTVRERMTTSFTKGERKFFSENFLTDLYFSTLGLVVAVLIVAFIVPVPLVYIFQCFTIGLVVPKIGCRAIVRFFM